MANPDDITLQIVFLKKLVDDKKQNYTWDEIASMVDLPSGESARSRWRSYNSGNPMVDEISPNNLVVNLVTNERITTVEQLLEIAGVNNSEEYTLSRGSVRKWDGYSKIEEVDLIWDDGKKSGTESRSGKVNLVELFYVRADFVKINPEPVMPIVQPIRYDLPERVRVINSEISTGHKILYLPDPHFGFDGTQPLHDEKALELIYQIAEDNYSEISHVIWGGDLWDLPDFSRFDTTPDLMGHLQKVVDVSGDWISGFIELIPDAEHIVLEGNHDKRFIKETTKLLPQLFGVKSYHLRNAPPVLTLPFLLGLFPVEDGGNGAQYIEGYPNEEYWVGDICFTHGNKTGRFGAGVQKYLKENIFNTVAGHEHRESLGRRTIRDKDGSRVITSVITGGLCRVDGIIPGVKKKQDWQQGALIIEYDSQGNHQYDLISIQNGSCYYRGQHYFD